jgi:hypothetical protein
MVVPGNESGPPDLQPRTPTTRPQRRSCLVSNVLNSLLIVFALYSCPSLWSNGQSSRPQIQRSGLDSRRHQTLRVQVGPERGPPSLVNTTEEPPERKSSCSGLENTRTRPQGSVTPNTWHPPSAKDGTNLADKWRSVGIVRSRTRATEFLRLYSLCVV